MDKIKMALGLDGAADAGEVLLAVVDLVQGCACAQAELARAREEVLAAREATADVFVEALVELGFMDAEALEAARAAYVANPDVAAVALLGDVDIVATANPDGCNQYGHRNGHRGEPIVLKKGSSGGGSGGGRSDGGGKRVLNFLKMGVKDADEPGLIDGLDQVDEQTRRKIRRKAREEYEADPEKYSGPEWKAWRKRYIED